MSILDRMKNWLTASSDAGDMLLGVAAVDIAAAEGESKPAKIEIVAYSGGIMQVAPFGPVAIELSGLSLPANLPLLADHKNELESVAGSGTPSIENGRLFIRGQLVRESEVAGRIIALSRGGVQLGASVGVKITQQEFITPGEKTTVNGKTLTAPGGGLLVVRAGALREVSIVGVGADATAHISKLAAQGTVMTNHTTDLQAALTAEREKTQRQLSAIGDLPEELLADGGDAIENLKASVIAGMTDSDFSRALVDTISHAHLRGSYMGSTAFERRNPPIKVRIQATGNQTDVLAAAMLMHAGFSSQAEKAYGQHVCEAANQYRNCSLLDLTRIALQATGSVVPHARDEMLRAAFSTNAMQYALSGIDKLAGVTFMETPATWRSFAAIKPLPNFRAHKVISPEHRGQLEKINPQGEVKHGWLSDTAGELKIDTYGKIIGIDRQHIINDDLDFLQDVGPIFARHAMRTINDLVWGVILANAGSFFSIGNGNLLDDELGLPGLSAAVAAMRKQRDADGNDLDIVPRVLAVCPELEAEARQLLNSQQVQRDQQADQQPTGNPLQSIAALEVESRLSNNQKFPNASASGWYLFGGPMSAPVYVGFLDGVETPKIEIFDQQPEFLGTKVRVYIDVGASLGEYRAAVKSSGDADDSSS